MLCLKFKNTFAYFSQPETRKYIFQIIKIDIMLNSNVILPILILTGNLLFREWYVKMMKQNNHL